MKPKEIIARRVALEFKDGDVVNLGFGIPNASAKNHMNAAKKNHPTNSHRHLTDKNREFL